MTRIGFQRKEGAGSSVRFDPDEDIGGNSISFHRCVQVYRCHCSASLTIVRPHPNAILTPAIIRRVGYRLRRRFGWTAANFVQVNKSQDSQQEAVE